LLVLLHAVDVSILMLEGHLACKKLGRGLV